MAQLAIGMVMSAIMVGISYLLAPKGKKSVDQLGMDSQWGAPVPVLYGSKRVQGQLIWLGDVYESSGGKGGPSQPHAYVSYAVAFTAGQCTALSRYWLNGVLTYDATSPWNVQSGTPGAEWRLYWGTEDQLPDPYVADWVAEHVPDAPDAVPAFRGMNYILFENLDMVKFGGMLPMASAQLTVDAAPNVPEIEFSSVGLPASESWNTDVCVDWVRRIAYVGNNLGVGVYQLLTMAQIGTILPAPEELAVWSGGFWVGGLAANVTCVPGQDFYSAVGGVLFRYSADSYTYVGSAETYTVWWQSITYAILGIAVGPGSWVICSGFGYCSLMNVTEWTPVLVEQVPMEYGGIWGQISFVPGIQYVDPAGMFEYSDVYVFNWSNPGSTDVVVYRIRLYPASVQSVEIIKRFQATDFNPSAEEWDGSDFNSPGSITGSWDQTDNTLILAVHNNIDSWGATIKWDPDSDTVVWQVANQEMPLNPQSNLSFGTLGFGIWPQSTYQLVDTRSGDTINVQQVTTNDGLSVNTGGGIYDSTTTSVVFASSTPTELWVAYLALGAPAGVPLGTIVSDLCARTGMLSPEQYDTSLLTEEVDGYIYDGNRPVVDAINELQQAYFFDVVESDYQLKFVPRPQAPIVTIPQSDLGSVAKEDEGNYWEMTIKQEQDLPTYVQIGFADEDNMFTESAAYAKRTYKPVFGTPEQERTVISLPISMHLSDAQVIAQKALWTAWAERYSYKTKLPIQYAYLDPTDVVTVNLDDGSTFTCRIGSVELGADYSIDATLVGMDAQSYSQSTTVQNTPGPWNSVPVSNTPSHAILLNVPLLTDTDSTGGTGTEAYYGEGAYGSQYAGSTLYSSPDSQSWSVFDTMPTSLAWGAAVTTLPETDSPFSLDTETEFIVRLVHADTVPSSISYVELLNGGNMAVVGYEVIQFQTVTPNADGTLTLSNLARGRRGTDWACNSHNPAEQVVIVDTTNLHKRTLALSSIGQKNYYETQLPGQTLGATPPTPWTFQGYDLKPYAPVQLSAEPDGSGDLVVRWTRRSRLSGASMIGTVPLNEDVEAYDAYLLAEPYDPVAANWAPPATYVRAWAGASTNTGGLSAPTLTYSAAEMSADSFNPTTGTLHVVVFQISAQVGPGWPAAADLQA